jgi:hypothetical protein
MIENHAFYVTAICSIARSRHSLVKRLWLSSRGDAFPPKRSPIREVEIASQKPLAMTHSGLMVYKQTTEEVPRI